MFSHEYCHQAVVFWQNLTETLGAPEPRDLQGAMKTGPGEVAGKLMGKMTSNDME